MSRSRRNVAGISLFASVLALAGCLGRSPDVEHFVLASEGPGTRGGSGAEAVVRVPGRAQDFTATVSEIPPPFAPTFRAQRSKSAVGSALIQNTTRQASAMSVTTTVTRKDSSTPRTLSPTKTT